jgi:hypothetical protein
MTDDTEEARGVYRFETRRGIDVYRDIWHLPEVVLDTVRGVAPDDYVTYLQQQRIFDVADIKTTIESWVTFDVDEYRDWRACARLVPDETGALVVAELRIIPKEDIPEDDSQPDGRLGEWSRETSAIPIGGLPARAVKRIRLGAHIRGAIPIARSSLQDAEVEVALPSERVSKATIQEWKTALAKDDVQARIKGKKRPRLEYAIVCKLYADFVDRGVLNTNVMVAEAMGEGWDAKRVRDVIRRSRLHPFRFLTKAPKHGVAGGELTKKALRILNDAENKEDTDGED